MEYRVTRLAPADSSTEKGRTTFEWKHPNGHQTTVYFRKAEQVSGGHYHKGEDPSKNPELFLLLTGSVQVKTITRTGEEREFLLDATDSPVSITMPPYVLHYFTGVTDITYIEYRVNLFDRNNPDTYSVERFYEEVYMK